MKLPESSHATARMSVVGAGKMGKLVIKHLAAKGCTKIVVANRTENKIAVTQEELKNIKIVYKPLSEMLACCRDRCSFTGTAQKLSFLLKRSFRRSLRWRLFVDIYAPRNVGSCMSDLETAQVYNVNDLNEVVAGNTEDWLQKAMEAQAITEDEVKEFEAWNDSL
ncbi:unnamed protein product [Fraxinus pennsylvanica]|uniref:Quinate/shikimate 5-dehydrogenase/glutamyl-tRNA reductase domain-containing protein n=1 Tax=Fraxinus pennsylvanica TaxID=56036 RepID=A0AAD2DTV4_9LAMI|nr:unnamed protein product [Fraxinus pennsylvanica]